MPKQFIEIRTNENNSDILINLNSIITVSEGEGGFALLFLTDEFSGHRQIKSKLVTLQCSYQDFISRLKGDIEGLY